MTRVLLNGKRICLILSGGIAAYKSLELIRLLKKAGAEVRGVMTEGAQQFVTPMSVAALSENQVYTDLWSLKDETEMGHIRLSRDADLMLVAPASANLIAKMAHGLADDLASTTLLASDKPVMIAPAMNSMMWENPATQRNIKTLEDQGVLIIGPESGETACGETGYGRMSEPETILQAVHNILNQGPLKGKTALVTSGPTYEPIDPVRFIGNRSSGKQGHAIARALAAAGADVTLVTGPVALPDPAGVKTIHVETAMQMYESCQASLPVDIAVCAAAVADWTPASVSDHKIKKDGNEAPFSSLKMDQTPDILSFLSGQTQQRPDIVVGFAAETDNFEQNAETKLKSKGCDILLMNDVSNGKAFGQDENALICFEKDGQSNMQKNIWDIDSKNALAQRLTKLITNKINSSPETNDKGSYRHAAE